MLMIKAFFPAGTLLIKWLHHCQLAKAWPTEHFKVTTPGPKSTENQTPNQTLSRTRAQLLRTQNGPALRDQKRYRIAGLSIVFKQKSLAVGGPKLGRYMDPFWSRFFVPCVRSRLAPGLSDWELVAESYSGMFAPHLILHAHFLALFSATVPGSAGRDTSGYAAMRCLQRLSNDFVEGARLNWTFWFASGLLLLLAAGCWLLAAGRKLTM